MENEGIRANHAVEYRKTIHNIETNEKIIKTLEEWKQVVVEEDRIKDQKVKLRKQLLEYLLNETHLYETLRNIVMRFPLLNLEIHFEKYIDHLNVAQTKLIVRRIESRGFKKGKPPSKK